MKKRVADIVIDILEKNGITDAFSVVGGGAMHLNNAFAKAKDKIHTVYNHHEQACAMAAEAYARVKGDKMAVVCVTSGPGGLNTLNGVQGAYVDSIPLLVIAGHPRYITTVEACGLDIRCRGVQENDIITQVKNITKYAVMIKDPLSVNAEIQKAIDMAMAGRRGPVWVSIPLDIQGMQIETNDCYSYQKDISIPSTTDEDIKILIDALNGSERPCILTGSGIRSGNAYENFKRFTSVVEIPIVGGVWQGDINVIGDKLYYGTSGSNGPRCGNFILQSADLILVLGNSLSTDQTGFNTEGFAPNANVIMVDIQADEAKKPGLNITNLIHSDLNCFFEKYINDGINFMASKQWINHCDMCFNELPQYEVLELKRLLEPDSLIHPALFWKKLSNMMEEDSIIALSNSSCAFWPGINGVNNKGQRLIANVHCGSMGDDIPEAIGAAAACDKSVYCITGEGSIMMNLQELQTVKYHEYPIKIFVFNNNGYGNIVRTCMNHFDGLKNGCDEESGISFPDFCKVAAAFDIEFKRINRVNELDEILNWSIEHKGPCIVEVMSMQDDERRPVLESKMDENGQFITPPLHDMYPFFDSDRLDNYYIS